MLKCHSPKICDKIYISYNNYYTDSTRERTAVTDNLKNDPYGQYDEAIIMNAVAVAHARSRTNAAIAASLCVPVDLLEEWLHEYEGKVDVRYIEGKAGGKTVPKGGFERCPKCGSKVVFDPIKAFEVLREEGVDIGTHNRIMDSGDDGIYGAKVPYVKITTELIARCPVCGVYTIRLLTDKLRKSEA